MPSSLFLKSAVPARVFLGVALIIGLSKTKQIKWLTTFTSDQLLSATLVLD